MKTNVELLVQHPLMQRLSTEQVTRIAQFGAVEFFHAGEVVVTAGQLGDAMFLVLSGKVLVEVQDRPVAQIGAGDFFGEMSLIEPAVRAATVTGHEDCELFRIPQFALANLMQDDPVALNQLLVELVRVLSQRLRRTNDLIGSVDRLAEYLAVSLV